MDALDKSKEIGAHQLIADLSEAVPNNRKRSHEDESKLIIDEVYVSEQKNVNKSHDKKEFDNVDIIDLIDDEEGEFFFGITELSENNTDELQIKLLKWQQHMLKKLESGTYPTSQNIHKLFAASSVFYFQQKTEDTYINFLTSCETAEIKSLVNSHFEHIRISDELEKYIKEYSISQNGCTNKTFRLLEEISVETKASKLRKSPAGDEEKKFNWDIYRASIHAKDAIANDIKKFNIQPSSRKKLAIFINGYKMVICVMKLQYPGIYLMVEMANCTISNSVRELESIMKLHQTLMSIKENRIDYLVEAGYSTPIRTNHLD
ncbi:10359_t:CDS:2 [Entrophospora sp. SA101]|nr:7625_t:CDS:2 [Entrophospora sp. SA101]CAJ0636525.1 10359_t:CDS:2 [Entrophospora sp. SA101]CAJ0900214.1 6822_t:CDS:2 [Entrophospora sp. SA101]CAJ0906648.1 9305_t:CDS:2 [Entrophospora sp. SA101]